MFTERSPQPASVAPRLARPVLVLLVGPPGVGKSTLAQLLHSRTGIEVIESDAVRRLMFGQPSYARGESHKVFNVVHRRAEETLSSPSSASVLIDATNLIEAERAVFYDIADALDASLIIVRLHAPRAVVRERLEARTRAFGDGPAGVGVYEQMRRRRQRILRPHFVVDTSGDIAPAIEAIVREIEAR